MDIINIIYIYHLLSPTQTTSHTITMYIMCRGEMSWVKFQGFSPLLYF